MEFQSVVFRQCEFDLNLLQLSLDRGILRHVFELLVFRARDVRRPIASPLRETIHEPELFRERELANCGFEAIKVSICHRFNSLFRVLLYLQFLSWFFNGGKMLRER
jgi:hypothetical protein